MEIPELEVDAVYAQYQMLCANGDEHPLYNPHRRDKLLQEVDRADARDCGPHRVQQRTVTKLVGPWGVMLETDPQTDASEAYMRAALLAPCPKCSAEVGERCIDKRAGSHRFTVWPHNERTEHVDA